MSNEIQEKGKVWSEWFDRPGSRRLLWRLLGAACILSVLAEWAVERKGYFGIDKKFAFFAVLGFSACAVMILVAKVLGFFLKRGEDYYGEAEPGAEMKGGLRDD